MNVFYPFLEYFFFYYLQVVLNLSEDLRFHPKTVFIYNLPL